MVPISLPGHIQSRIASFAAAPSPGPATQQSCGRGKLNSFFSPVVYTYIHIYICVI